MNYDTLTNAEYLALTNEQYLSDGIEVSTSNSIGFSGAVDANRLLVLLTIGELVLITALNGFKQGAGDGVIRDGNIVYANISTSFGLAGIDQGSSGQPTVGEVTFSDVLCVDQELTRILSSQIAFTGFVGTNYPSTIQDPPIGFELPIIYNKRLFNSLAFSENIVAIGGRILDDSCFPAKYIPNGYVPAFSDIEFSQVLTVSANNVQTTSGQLSFFDYADVFMVRTLQTSSDVLFSDQLISARNYDFALVDEIVFDQFAARFQGYDATASSDIGFAGVVEGGRVRDVAVSSDVAFLGAGSGSVGVAGDDWSGIDDWSELTDWSNLE